ncbi:MAG: ABC transporter permease subunit [Candidatus Eisenbacteria bacterium]|nr:ABC transporter permease subunit [Candidatus Latescibacterota bacterium]MBD3303101.1 ABC transporter permease subunit [Candidatus Eisenbacteria bacterium]
MAWIYLLPAAVLLLGLLAVPLAATLPAGLPLMPQLFGDASLLQVSGNTLAFAGITVALELVLGVLFALLLNQPLRGQGPVRAVAILPWALPTAVMALAWRWIFNDTYGIANDLPVRLGLLSEPVAWLGRPALAFATIVVADVWKTTPFVTILLLAGLQSVPDDLHEAMRIDGAGPVRRFFWITLPMLRPAIGLAITFRLIHALGIFDLVWVLTGGGPANATKTIALYIYDQFFRYGQLAYGAALTIVAALAMFVLAGAAGALIRGRARG